MSCSPRLSSQPHHLRHEVQFVPSRGGDKGAQRVGGETHVGVGEEQVLGRPGRADADRHGRDLAGPARRRLVPAYNVRTDAASYGSRTVGTRVIHDDHSKSAWVVLREQAGQSRRQDFGFVARRHDRRHIWPPAGRVGVRRRRQTHRGAPEPAVAEREVDPRGER